MMVAAGSLVLNFVLRSMSTIFNSSCVFRFISGSGLCFAGMHFVFMPFPSGISMHGTMWVFFGPPPDLLSTYAQECFEDIVNIITTLIVTIIVQHGLQLKYTVQLRVMPP